MTSSAVSADKNIIGYLPDGSYDPSTVQIGEGSRIRSGTVVYAGATIGANLDTGHNVVIRERNVLGSDVCIWSNTVVDYGCTIGNRVKIHNNVYIPQFTIIEDDVFIAPGCTFANDMFPGCPESKKNMRGPTIRRGAQIGVNVTILPSVTIGEYAMIGSGSVVTSDIPSHSVAWGNPARVHKTIQALNCCTDDPSCPIANSSTSI